MSILKVPAHSTGQSWSDFHESPQERRSARCVGSGARRHGFTLVELMLAVAIVGVLASIAIPSYLSYTDRMKVDRACVEIRHIETLIAQFETQNASLPGTLDDLRKGSFIDPWGNPYEYLNLANIKGKGKARKNKSLVPINSDYDLYSMGKDGSSASPLTAKQSRDDVVRARNGGFVGLASGY